MMCPPRAHVGPIELRRRDGSRAARQCAACLKADGPAVSLRSLPADRLRKLPLWIRPEPEAQPGRRKKDQGEFYRSRQGRQLSKLCLQRDGYVCRVCGEEANQAYHLRYPEPPLTIWDTTLEMVVASCGPCNADEREQRIVRGVLGLPQVQRSR